MIFYRLRYPKTLLTQVSNVDFRQAVMFLSVSKHCVGFFHHRLESEARRSYRALALVFLLQLLITDPVRGRVARALALL